jgi:hypothetical protein
MASTTKDQTLRLAPFNPTSDEAIAAALDLAALSPDDVVVDLGCGDGRVLLAAARSCPGVRCRGWEWDEGVAARGLARIAAEPDADVRGRVQLDCGDATAVSLDEEGASCVFVYLVPEGLGRVGGRLRSFLLGGEGGGAGGAQLDGARGSGEAATREDGEGGAGTGEGTAAGGCPPPSMVVDPGSTPSPISSRGPRPRGRRVVSNMFSVKALEDDPGVIERVKRATSTGLAVYLYRCTGS